MTSVRDDQARRYARHLKLPEIGGLGQIALLVSSARVTLREREPAAELVAAAYLAAGGVGTVNIPNATAAQVDDVAARGVDTRVVADDSGREVVLAPRPPWWPGADGDDIALAYWRGARAAIRWMTETIERR
jgi:hypothetical protein